MVLMLREAIAVVPQGPGLESGTHSKQTLRCLGY